MMTAPLGLPRVLARDACGVCVSRTDSGDDESRRLMPSWSRPRHRNEQKRKASSRSWQSRKRENVQGRWDDDVVDAGFGFRVWGA